MTSIFIFSQNQILLHIQLRIPNTRCYAPYQEILWDTSKGPTVQDLKQVIADAVCLPVDGIEIAKHFVEKYEWLVIKELTKGVSLEWLTLCRMRRFVYKCMGSILEIISLFPIPFFQKTLLAINIFVFCDPCCFIPGHQNIFFSCPEMSPIMILHGVRSLRWE